MMRSLCSLKEQKPKNLKFFNQYFGSLKRHLYSNIKSEGSAPCKNDVSHYSTKGYLIVF